MKLDRNRLRGWMILILMMGVIFAANLESLLRGTPWRFGMFIAWILFYGLFFGMGIQRLRKRTFSPVVMTLMILNSLIGNSLLISFGGQGNFSQHVFVGSSIIIPALLDYPDRMHQIMVWFSLGFGAVAFVAGEIPFQSGMALLFVIFLSFTLADLVKRQYRSDTVISDKARQFRTLYEISKSIDAFPDMEAMAERVTRTIGEHFKVNESMLFLYDKESEQLEAIGTYSDGLVPEKTTFAPGEGIVGTVMVTGKPIITSDIAMTPDIQDHLVVKDNVASFAVLPVFVENTVEGILVLIHHLPYEMSEDLVSFMQIVCARIGSLIENKVLYSRIERLSQIDGMTGLYTHALFHDVMERELARAIREESRLDVLIIDIDRFKRINDTFGHLAGDQVIKKISGIILESVRRTDIAGRYGGEEFAILAHVADDYTGERIARRIMDRIDQFNREGTFGIGDTPVHVSIGVAHFPAESMLSRQLIDIADQKMYIGKNKGGNATVA